MTKLRMNFSHHTAELIFFSGEWRGCSIRQIFGSVCMSLHKYQMKKSARTGAPLVGKDGKILTTTSKWVMFWGFFPPQDIRQNDF